MRITWVTRSFADYRIPVFKELDRLCGNNLYVVYNGEIISEKLQKKIEECLGKRAVSLTGELRLGGKKIENSAFANSGIRIPYQPGLLKSILTSRPDVMVSDGFMQWTYAPLLLRVMKHIPHVMCYERTAYTERHCQWYRKWYRKLALHAIDAVGANGILCGEYLQSLGVKPENIFYGHMAADNAVLAEHVCEITDAESLALRQKIGLTGTVFLYVGQIIPRKGIRELLTAWKKWNPTDASLLLVGDGSELKELRGWSIPNVFWLGKRSYDELVQYYRCADVFIIPTLEDNWSLVVPEAMACCLPIACSKYNGCHPELVHPENGWVFDPLNSEETVAMLNEILTKQDNLPIMGQRSREIVKDFSPKHAAESIFIACRKTTLAYKQE